jgi:hypothetical protein
VARRILLFGARNLGLTCVPDLRWSTNVIPNPKSRHDSCPVQGPDAPAQAAPATTAPSVTSGSRRNFLIGGGMLSMSSLMGAAALMTQSDDPKAATSWAEHFQGNYRLMTPEEKAEAAARLARRYTAQYRKDVTVSTTEAATRRADGLCIEYSQMHRLPSLRQGLRRGKQPVPRGVLGRTHRMDSSSAHGAW